MAILLAVATAVGWGAADFFGGDATRRQTPVFVVVAITELLGLAPVISILILRGSAPPDNPRLLFAALAGAAVAIELGLIYRAIAGGNAFITAPVGALGSAAAVTVGLVGGDSLNLSIGFGLACAVFGGAISAWTPPTARGTHSGGSWQTTATGLGAAGAVGIMLISLHQAGRLDPYWATAIEHASTALAATAVVLITRRAGRLAGVPSTRDHLPALALIAAVGMGGDLAYTAASHQGGALSIVSAISSLYPVATITLGRVLRRDRATRTQLTGICFAVAGAVLLGAAVG